MTSVMRQSSLLKYANARLKRITVEIDDDDYVPSLGGNDNADESSSSSMHEILYMRYYVIYTWNNQLKSSMCEILNDEIFCCFFICNGLYIFSHIFICYTRT